MGVKVGFGASLRLDRSLRSHELAASQTALRIRYREVLKARVSAALETRAFNGGQGGIRTHGTLSGSLL